MVEHFVTYRDRQERHQLNFLRVWVMVVKRLYFLAKVLNSLQSVQKAHCKKNIFYFQYIFFDLKAMITFNKCCLYIYIIHGGNIIIIFNVISIMFLSVHQPGMISICLIGQLLLNYNPQLGQKRLQIRLQRQRACRKNPPLLKRQCHRALQYRPLKRYCGNQLGTIFYTYHISSTL